MDVEISSCVIDLIHREAARAAPMEGCGLLFGDGAVRRASVTANVAADPARHFEIDPAALIAALRNERQGEERVMGYWHSHPSGDASPSATDAAMAAPDGRLWLIVGGGVLTAWRAGERGVHGRFDRVGIKPV